MKLLVISDSHKNIIRMHWAVDYVMPDVIVHLGDHISDAQKLRDSYHNIHFYMVTGNCDFNEFGKSELMLPLGGVKIFITHGHIYRVKSGLASLVGKARELDADLVLHGHTHRASVHNDGKLWIMCPGQMERHDKIQAASYGVVIIEEGQFECGIEMLPTINEVKTNG